MLWYQPCGYQQFRDLAQCEPSEVADRVESRAHTLLQQHDAFKDTPWPVLFRMCDRACPGSKFIHVTRNEESWLRSVVKDFGHYPNSIHHWIYGEPFPKGNEQRYLSRYQQHNAEVRDYFKGRENDFISLSLERGEVGWDSICEFLGHTRPEDPWPHLNTAADKRRRMFISRVRARAMKLIGR